MSVNFLTIPQKTLSQSIASNASAFKLSNIKSWKLNSLGVNINLVAGDFGTQAFGVFRNDTGTIIEIFEFDPATIASTSITILKRGLDFNGDLTTQTTNYKLDWPAGSIVMLGTDTPQLFQYLKDYIDAAIISGAADASTTVKGLVEEATQAEITAGTDTGGTGAKLFAPPSKLNTQIDAKILPYITKFSTTEVFNGTAPTSFTDLDLSAVVGAVQRMVVLRISVPSSTAVGVLVKTKGDTKTYTFQASFFSMNNVYIPDSTYTQTVLVKTNTSGVIQWIASNATAGTMIDVLAYW